VEVGHATSFQIQQLFQRFYPEASLEKSRHFAQAVANKGQNVTMAQIQGYFLRHKSDPEGVVLNLNSMWQ